VKGLSNGRHYKVHVRASNDKGEGPASARVEVTPVSTPVPTVSFLDPAYFTYPSEQALVVLSQPASNTVQVNFTTSDGGSAVLYWAQWVGGAAAFSPNSGTVTFAPGQTSSTIPLAVDLSNFTGDGCVILAQTPCYPSVAVTLTDPTNAILGTTPVTDLFYYPTS
jgi:hypothetical protein